MDGNNVSQYRQVENFTGTSLLKVCSKDSKSEYDFWPSRCLFFLSFRSFRSQIVFVKKMVRELESNPIN